MDQVAVKSRALSRPVAYGGKEFTTLDEVTAYINEIDEADRYGAQQAILERMVKYHSRAGDLIEEMYKYVHSSGVYRKEMTEGEFKEAWAGVLTIIQENKARRNRLKEAKNAVLKHWDEPVAVAWVDQLGESATFMVATRRIAMAYGHKEAVLRINKAVVERLKKTGRGISTAKCVLTGDIDKARLGSTSDPAVMISAITLKELGIRVGKYGLVEEDNGTGEAGGLLRESPEENRDAEPQGDGLVKEDDGTGEAGGLLGESPEENRDAEPQGDGQGNDGGIVDLARPAGEIERGVVGRQRTKLTIEEEEEFQLMDSDQDSVDEKAIDEAEDELAGGDRTEGFTTDGEDDRNEGVDDRRARKRRRVEGCGCSMDVTDAWKATIMKKRALGLTADMKLLARHQGFQRVCYAHSKAMGGHLGLMVKRLNRQELADRIRIVHENSLTLGELKTNPVTYKWFRVANRPARPSDSLGPYKFMPVAAVDRFEYNQQAVLSSISEGISDAWIQDGTINVDLFSWWFRGPIGEIVLAEFDMYRHHLREINGKSNYGWLRNMLYSIGQQLMRQDPLYYMLYASLRPDKQWRLVTYPYYAKYAVEGDLTYFRHLDLNIPQLIANGRGACMIQGSVSLDEEDETNCTVLIPGIQHKLGEWWGRCVARGQETDGFVHRITEQMFTREDAEVLGVDWKRVPCRRGEVRVTLPHLPHGSDGPSTGIRRTMLPWFVGVQDDQETLDVVEGGTWSDLSTAHRDLVSPKATPSGLANRYGAIPYRFPAAVEINGLGALSDALVCRRRWDSPLVLRDRDLLLGNDRSKAVLYVRQWRALAEKVAIDAFEAVKEAEEEAFGEKSYFYHKRRLETRGIPFPEVEEDQEELDGDAVAQDRTVLLAFAEEGEEEM